jgi:DNA modification methylase
MIAQTNNIITGDALTILRDDAEAISEPIAGSSTQRYLQKAESTAAAPRFGGNKYKENNDGDHRKSGSTYSPKSRRNKRDVWSIATGGYKGAHFAVFPPTLVRPCILAGSKPGGVVLDPFIGSGTTAVVALEEGRQYIGIDINANYAALAAERIEAAALVMQKGATHER